MGLSTEDLVLMLYKLECVKFGAFTLKSGVVSPFYIDLRIAALNPVSLKVIANFLWSIGKTWDDELICGVPYAAMPLATAISLEHNIPCIMCRKEPKDYGRKLNIEGAFKSGDKCIIIEDVMTLGASILKTKTLVEDAGLVAVEARVIVDRESHGSLILKEAGITVHSVITISSLLQILRDNSIISESCLQDSFEFIQLSQEGLYGIA